MPRSRMTPVIYVLIGLAVVGLIMKLATDAMGLLTNLLIMIGIAAILYFVLNHFFLKNRGGSSDETKKYKQAVKQSKRKYKGSSTANSKASAKSAFNPSPVANNKKKKKAHAAHLRVIEGNKNKKKNRASS